MNTSCRCIRRSIAASGRRLLLLLVLFSSFSGRWCVGDDKPLAGGKVILVRGVLTVFSLGLDDLAVQLVHRGYETEVVPASLSYLAVDKACKRYATGELTGPFVLIGHSLGGDMLPGLAERLAADRRAADLMVMIDSTFPSNCPPNVRRCVNLYQTNSSPDWFRILPQHTIKTTNPATQLVNIDVRSFLEFNEAAKLNHFNIEASPWIHGIVIEEVDRVMRMGPKRTTEEKACRGIYR